MVLFRSLYDEAFLRYFTLKLQKRGPRPDVMRPFGYIITGCLRHCGKVVSLRQSTSTNFSWYFKGRWAIPNNPLSPAMKAAMLRPVRMTNSPPPRMVGAGSPDTALRGYLDMQKPPMPVTEESDIR